MIWETIAKIIRICHNCLWKNVNRNCSRCMTRSKRSPAMICFCSARLMATMTMRSSRRRVRWAITHPMGCWQSGLEKLRGIFHRADSHRAQASGKWIHYPVHNGATYTADALETVINSLRDQGYEIVPISELIHPRSNIHMVTREGRLASRRKNKTVLLKNIFICFGLKEHKLIHLFRCLRTSVFQPHADHGS